MRSKVILTALIVFVTAFGIYTLIHTFSLTGDNTLEQAILDSKNSSTPQQQTNHSDTLLIPQADYKEYLEIEVTADDINKADTSNFIGLSEPFNSEYITRQDVISSINRIGGEDVSYTQISKKYQNEFLTLRHVEMIEGVSESDSKVRSALKEYVEKVRPIEKENGTFDGEKQESKENKEQTISNETNDVLYKSDVSIAETEQLLQGGN